ncbi:uncharacterized protein LOC122391150 [Amphibalanus amphitrite]|uniref:uncharacterized protein LOC122391150 n=1 Tax=Amphibalanus amphitrite TaxID=1232801 RepID=UPI001C900223|nr:uncharacterized protein LOC122391150 [Amphibalanus amphitrite]
MLKHVLARRSLLLMMRMRRCKWYSSNSHRPTADNEILELQIINHLYSDSLRSLQHSSKVFDQGNKDMSNDSTKSSIIFLQSLDVIRPHTRPNRHQLTVLTEAALSGLTSSPLSAAERDLLLVSAALVTRRPDPVRPAVLSALADTSDTGATLRLLYVAGVARLRLPAALWRSVQRRLADRCAALSEPDLLALSSSSFRCGAAVSSGWLQQRLLSAARRLADSDRQTGPLVALLKALRLARVSCAPLLASLRGLVSRRGAALSLPAAAHLGACWCSPPLRDPALLAALEATLRGRLETLLNRQQISASGSCPDGSSVSLIDDATDPVPDGRPKDVARLLYTFAHLGHMPSPDTLEVTERWMAGWSTGRPLPLVDALLSLAILGRYPQTLLERVLTEDVAQRLAAAGRPRQLSRLALLHQAARLEAGLRPPPLRLPAADGALPVPCLQRELRRRPRLAALLERVRRQQPAARVELGYPVPHVNSASVLLSWPDGRRAAVELLDGDALLLTVSNVSGRPYVTGCDGVSEQYDVSRRRDVSGSVVTVPDDATGSGVGAPCGTGEGRSVTGPETAVGLIRLKARLSERLGYLVWWDPGLACG